MRHAEVLFLTDGSPLFAWLGSLLAARGYGVAMTDRTDQALALLRAHRPALTVIKVDAACLGGLEVLPQVRTLAPGARLMAISSQRLLPEAVLEVEADDYLILPARPLEVWRRLMSLLPEPSARLAPRPEPYLHPANASVLNRLVFMLLDLQRCLTVSAAGLEELGRTHANGSSAEQQRLLELLQYHHRHTLASTHTFLEAFFRHNFLDAAAQEDRPSDRV